MKIILYIRKFDENCIGLYENNAILKQLVTESTIILAF